MHDSASYQRFLTPGAAPDAEGLATIESVQFENPELARTRFQSLARTPAELDSLVRVMPALLAVLEEAATPDLSLINLDRFLRAGPDSSRTLRFLADNPRAVEILVRLFVGSQYLTDILLQNPGYLERLTQHKGLAEIKSRQQLTAEGLTATQAAMTWADRMTALRHFQKWELLRIAACDSFGLMDFKVTTLQLSLLADSIVQLALRFAAEDLKCDPSNFCVLAMGKLGGEELNYSSDIDLVFVCEEDAGSYASMAQRLVRGLSDMTVTGFLYRVDMRLRPWGKAGALVTTRNAYFDYMRREGRLWEKQALLKARPIAGNLEFGQAALQSLKPEIFQVDAEVARQSVLNMKREIEKKLEAQGLIDSEIKSGRGGIRDIEFIAQYLQLVHGGETPGIRSINTLDGLVRLADQDVIQADEYRQLTGGYVFLRTVEHSLQLLHNKQEHTLPKSERELSCLARRIDFPSSDEFISYYNQHRAAIRRIFDKYVEKRTKAPPVATAHAAITQHLGGVMPGYAERFNEVEQRQHLAKFESLSPTNRVRVIARPAGENLWNLSIVGYDEPGGLSVICGLLLSHGLNIESGDVFTGKAVGGMAKGSKPHREFIDVLQVRSRDLRLAADFWPRYESELNCLMVDNRPEARAANQGRLVRRVASLIEFDPDSNTVLLPLEIDFDNEADSDATVLRISGEDTIGFLYELANALTLCGIQILRVTIRSTGHLASDTLYVTDETGNKISDPKRLSELRAAVMLIKHFTHMLPQSPNPEAALIHFRELLVKLFERPDWAALVASLDQTEVLGSLSRMLGVSDYLGEELLRQELGQVMPIVTELELRKAPKSLQQLQQELDEELRIAGSLEEQRGVLNAFKDREMLRIDMRHVLGHQDSFTGFSHELSDIADVIVQTTRRVCEAELQQQYGTPMLAAGRPCRMAILALGKSAGRELGFASDIELMFLYEDTGHTSGPRSICNEEFYDRLVDLFVKSIHSRRKGIFELDLRLRPHGKAGSRAVSVETFRRYFSLSGPAWPFERQALVKMRPVAGDRELGEEIVAIRDELIYTRSAFDIAAMRAIRDRQIRQLVIPGSFNAKLSPGGLVDIEYLVQGLQMIHGQGRPDVRTPNTREAMKALEVAGVLTVEQRLGLRDAYRFMRRLIDVLRMVRGDATDLTVPHRDSEEFHFLARRMRMFKDTLDLAADLESYSSLVLELSRTLLPTSGAMPDMSGG